MIEELQYVNLWLQSKDPYLMRKHGIDKSYFVGMTDVVGWIEKFRDDMKGVLPSTELVNTEFEEFRLLKELDPPEYLVNVLREQRAYMDYRPVLVENGKMLNDGKSLEAMWKMRHDLDSLLKKFTGKISHHDWVKNAMDRYDKYMEKHGVEGLTGISSGIRGLDELTGGWKNDDFILLAGRLNEGKSFVGSYFAYMAWQSLRKAGINAPVVYITTEMPEFEIGFRLDTLRAHFGNRALNEGKLPDADLYKEYAEGLMKIDHSFLIMSQNANGGRAYTPADIRAIVESERPGFIVIDQLYDISDGTGERDIRRRIVNVTNDLREINLYTQTPTMFLSQAGRESAKEAKKDVNATPDLHQVQESDNPAQKATKAITLRMIHNVFKMSLKKNRGGKKDEDIYMRVDLDQGIWEESTKEEMVF